MLYPNELVIHERTPSHVTHHPVIDGERKGMGLVPRDFSVDPPTMFESPSEMKVYPRSEWSRLLKEQLESKSRLSDIRMRGGPGGTMIPSLDQDGKGYCATEDTEVLTENGWVAWPEYDWLSKLGTVNTTTRLLEYQYPLQRHVYEYEGPMVYSTNRRIDFGMTPDHRMLVRKWDEAKRTLSDRYSFVRAGELGWYSGLMHAPNGVLGVELETVSVEGDPRVYQGDDFIALLSVVISCGWAGEPLSGTKNWVSFCCFRDKAYAEYDALATRCGFHRKPNEPNVWIRYDAGALAQWFRDNCYVRPPYRAITKRLPDIVRCASTRQIELFLKWYGDRSHADRDGTVYYYSSSRRLIDDLQLLNFHVGKRGTITREDPQQSVIKSGVNEGKVINSKETFVLVVSKTDRLCLERKKHLEKETYKGLVYCATVPNGTLVTRRNGTVLISGNCWAHSTTSAVMLLRALQNEPYIRLSAYAIACVIKNFRDEGGWCGLSAKFWRERGCPSSEFWPEQSMSRSNDRPETWENAAKHKVTEDWVDLSKDVYDQNLTFEQVVTCCIDCNPMAWDFSDWSHSVGGMDAVDGQSVFDQGYRAESGKKMKKAEFDKIFAMDHPVTGGIAIRLWNSWGDQWSEKGMGIRTGSKAIPDGAVALRVTGASQN